MIVKTQAIVLSTMKYGETSKIARLYTREFGNISVLAKGARAPSSKFRGTLEPARHVLAVLYKKEHRELHLLSQCDLLDAFRRIPESMERMRAAWSAIELVNLVTHGEERNEELFDLLLKVLQVINAATKPPWAALYYFELRLAGLLGFQPELDVCSRCAKPIPEAGLAVRYGFGPNGILCENCAVGASVVLSSAALSALRALRRFSSPEGGANIRLTQQTQQEISRVLRTHFQAHIDGFRGLKSDRVFAEL